jgi:transcriptional regulator with XRE-family HTH domain
MKDGASGPFGAQLRALREAAGFTQEELATIAGLSVHAVSALERGHRGRPQLETVRALSAALDVAAPARDALLASARIAAHTASEKLGGVALPVPLTALLGREIDLQSLRRLLDDAAVRLIMLTDDRWTRAYAAGRRISVDSLLAEIEEHVVGGI